MYVCASPSSSSSSSLSLFVFVLSPNFLYISPVKNSTGSSIHFAIRRVSTSILDYVLQRRDAENEEERQHDDFSAESVDLRLEIEQDDEEKVEIRLSVKLFEEILWKKRENSIFCRANRVRRVDGVSETLFLGETRRHDASTSFAVHRLCRAVGFPLLWLHFGYFPYGSASESLRSAPKHVPLHVAFIFSYLHEPKNRGNEMTSRILSRPRRKRSKPRPKPPWGMAPNLAISKYLNIGECTRTVSLPHEKRTSHNLYQFLFLKKNSLKIYKIL